MSQRVAAADQLLAEFNWEVAHCRHVRDLAVGLFDHLQPLHGHGPAERDLLAAAALLHDLGWTGGGAKHHKRSAQMIRDHAVRLPGFTAREIELIAQIARYHRKAEPSLDHEPYAALPPDDQQRIRRLAALLRLADGLDRPHLQWARVVAAHIEEHRVVITIAAVAETGLHITGSERKRGLFEAAFDRVLRFQAAPVP